MNRSRANIAKIILATLIMGLLVYLYLDYNSEEKYNWQPHYKSQSTDPYGTYLFHELLKGSFDEENFNTLKAPLSSSLINDSIVDANYIFIGEEWFYDYDDLDALIEFVRRGNHAYLLSPYSPYDLLSEMDEISSLVYFGSSRSKSVKMSLDDHESDSSIELRYTYNWREISHDWTYAEGEDILLAEPEIVALGTIDEDQVNYFKVPIGAGELHFHLTPLVFTNFHLREEQKLAYVNEVLADAKKGAVYWDAFSNSPSGSSDRPSESPLSYILSQPPLQWAWYIILASGLIYLIFYTKRKQRIIPVMARIPNTSLQFVKTMASMYFHQQATMRIIRHQYQLFLMFVRTKYNISTSQIDDTFSEQLSLKSGIDKHEIEMIHTEMKRLEKLGDVTGKDLIEYNKKTHSFYSNCK